MEAWQHVKLSHTNRSIGLIHRLNPMQRLTPPAKARNTASGASKAAQRENLPEVALGKFETALKKPPTATARHRGKRSGLDDLVAMARGQTPDPIPNSAVKTLSANGTAS